MCVLRLRKTKQKGESPSVIKGPDAHTEEYGLYSEGGGWTSEAECKISSV